MRYIVTVWLIDEEGKPYRRQVIKGEGQDKYDFIRKVTSELRIYKINLGIVSEAKENTND